MIAGHGSREELVAGLVRAGELLITGEDEAAIRAYFAPDFVFHGPDGVEADLDGLNEFFASLRAAFDDRTITRGIIVVEGNDVACQTSITGHSSASSPTRRPGRFHRTETESSSSSPTSFATTTKDGSQKSGSRPTTGVCCAS